MSGETIQVMKGGYQVPDEVMENVMSRLPGKSIFKFKSLSKKWRYVLSSLHFIRQKNLESIKNPTLLSLYQQRTGTGGHKHILITSSLSGEVLDRWDIGEIGLHYPKMLHSPWGPNNLVCLVVGLKRLVVCNPSTREISVTDLFSFPDVITAAGFGYVPRQNCYTIVCQTGNGTWKMINFGKDPSSSNGFSRWNHIDGGYPGLVDELRWAVAAKGILYWARSTHQDPLLVCFDLSDGRFFTVSMPDEIKGPESKGVYSILEMNDDLYLAYWRVGGSMIELWRLDDPANERWTKNLIRLTGFHQSFGSHFRPLEVVDGMMLIYSGDFLDWYEMKNGVFRKIKKRSIKVPDSSGITDFQLYMDVPFR